MSASDDSTPFVHRPVMVDEIVALVEEVPSGEWLDATVGGGGHAVAILERRPDLQLVGLDRDPDALEAAAETIAPHRDRVRLRRARFDGLAEILDELGVDRLCGFLFDLGVSSPQLDRGERGFSFRNDGPLDMRMDPSSPLTAADVVNDYDRVRLAACLRRNADERFATRIADAIIAARPLSSTAELADVVVGAIPAAARRTGGHPAKRTFQALRIEVNAELEVLQPALEAALDVLAVGGRGLVLTYHSGEDRIVKDVFRRRVTSSDPPGLPIVDRRPDFVALRPLARRPQDTEVAENPRAASARLRSIERVAA